MPTINDRLLRETTKASSAGRAALPFQGYGSGWGMSPIYSSFASWDAALDRAFGGQTSSKVDWAARAGDPSTSSLMMSLYRFLGNVLPEAPLKVRKKTGGTGGSKGKSVNVDDHPMVSLWNHPNEHYSGSNLMKGLAFSWATRSEAYILKAYNEEETEVLELWYEPPWSIRPMWPVDGSDFISHYEVYRNGSWTPIDKKYVIHLRDGFHPYNQRIGFETSWSILPELAGDREAGYYYANLMGGSAVPPFLVGVDSAAGMNQVQAEQLQATLERRTTGDERGKPMVVRGGKAYKLAFTPRELDLRDTRYMPEERFCAVKGCPAVVLELGSGQAHSIYNNVKQAEERAWYSYVLPLLRHLAEELTTKLLTDFEPTDEKGRITSGAYIEHDIDGVAALQEDVDAKGKRVGALYKDGIIKRREARSQMGFDSSNIDNPEDWSGDDVWYADVSKPAPPAGLPGAPGITDEVAGAEEVLKRVAAARLLRARRAPRQLTAGRMER